MATRQTEHTQLYEHTRLLFQPMSVESIEALIDPRSGDSRVLINGDDFKVLDGKLLVLKPELHGKDATIIYNR